MIDKVNYNLIHKIIEIGRLEELPTIFNPKNNWWLSVLNFHRGDGCDDLSTEALKYLYKGVVLTEKESERYMGSTTNTRLIYYKIEDRLKDSENRNVMDELYDFGIANSGNNRYVPR
jgi:predicted Zn-dependent protease with MMP-like domain